MNVEMQINKKVRLMNQLKTGLRAEETKCHRLINLFCHITMCSCYLDYKVGLWSKREVTCGDRAWKCQIVEVQNHIAFIRAIQRHL